MGRILTWARDIEAKHALFLFDSCFSGAIFKAKALPKIPPHISDVTSRPVRQFISAGSAGEEVPANSVFTPSFIRAVRGEGDLDKDGYVTGTELGMYLHRKVLSYDTGQTPQYGKIKDPDLDEGDFVFALRSPSPPPPQYDRLQEERERLEQERRELERMKMEIERKKLEDAEKKFLQFKQGMKLISLEESEKTIAQKISNFNDAYIQAKNKRLEVVARLRQLSNVMKSDKNISHIRRLSSLIKNDLIDSLYNELINAEGERQRLQKVYKSKHQKIVEINTRIATLRTKLNQEIRKELDNLRAEQELLSRKEKVIQRTISDLKDEAMDMNKSGLTYSILKRNVEMNQGLYDIILSKLKEVDITNNIAMNNIRILEKAFLPSAPIAPNKRRNTILVLVMGLMIGVGISFLLENIDRTLHSDEDTEKYLDLPVLSMIPLAGKAKAASYGAKP